MTGTNDFTKTRVLGLPSNTLTESNLKKRDTPTLHNNRFGISRALTRRVLSKTAQYPSEGHGGPREE